MKTIWRRAGVGIVTTGLMTVAMTTPAAAEDDFGYGGVAQVAEGYILHDAAGQTHEAAMLTLKQDNGGNPVLSYSLDAGADVDTAQRVYEEADTAETDIAALGKVRSVLEAGYPTADPAALATDAEVDLADLADAERIAYTATQAAIWSLTDDFEWDADITDQGTDIDIAVAAISEYLVDNAADTGDVTNEVRVDGPQTGAQDGAIGPYTASTAHPNGAITVSAEGGDPVAANGSPVDEIVSDEEFYIDPDSDIDSVTITARATDVPAGLALLATDQQLDNSSDSAPDSAAIVLAEHGDNGATARTTVEIGSQSQHSVLPVTGATRGGVLLLGLGLVLTGATVVFFASRPARATGLFGRGFRMFHPP